MSLFAAEGATGTGGKQVAAGLGPMLFLRKRDRALVHPSAISSHNLQNEKQER